MLIFLAFAAILLITPILGIWPSVREGRALNTLATVWLPADGSPKYATRPRIALAAQEVTEFWLAWAGAVVLSVPVAVVLAVIVPSVLAGPLTALLLPLAWTWRRTTWGERQLEYIGHAAEWVTAEKLGTIGYTQHEVAGRLITGYGQSDDRRTGLFDHMTVFEVGQALRRRRWIARICVALLARSIRRA